MILQDGSRAGFRVSTGMAKLMGKVTGSGLQEFLDRMEAYYYFPLIIAKDSELAEGTIRVEVKAVGGHIDRAGGIVFGLRSLGNYFVWRLNALEDNLVLFEYDNHKRFQRASSQTEDRIRPLVRAYSGTGRPDDTGISGRSADSYAMKRPTPLKGYVGLWTKADSVTWFRNFTLQRTGRTTPTPAG